jgi:hypothetical protein
MNIAFLRNPKKYIFPYYDILAKYRIKYNDEFTSNIYKIIESAFIIDDYYDTDTISENTYKSTLNTIREQIKSPIFNKELDLLIESHRAEHSLGTFKNLDSYLSITSKNIGIQLITGYLADLNQINSEIWFSKKLIYLNTQVNHIARLSNDYIDYSKPRELSDEHYQVKAGIFFSNKHQFKKLIIRKYLTHKFQYKLSIFIATITFADNTALKIAESALDWAFDIYFHKEDRGR